MTTKTIAAILVFALSALPLCAQAERLRLRQPQPAQQPVGEAATNAVVCLTDRDASRFRIVMSVDGGEAGCAMLEFGCDADGNGVLDRCEVELSVGWDCGEWVCRDRRNGFVATAARTPGRRSLDMRVRIDRDSGEAIGLDASDGEALFQGMPLGGLFNPAWNVARLVTRGGESVESASVLHLPEPLVITIR